MKTISIINLKGGVAKTLTATTPAQIGRYDAIIRHLCPEFKAELKEDRINISTAYELSGLAPEDQQAAFAEYQESGTISIKDARAKKPDAQPPAEEVAESDPPATAPENPQATPIVEPPEETPPRPSSPPPAATVTEVQPDEEPQGEADTPPEPPAESGFRQQDPPAEPQEAENRARTVRQLQSLRDHCEVMNESDTDDGSRIWALDVDALEYAICALNKG